jgi:hypothetical protein
MENEIEEELCKHYDNIHVQVEYLDIRRYKIEIINNYINTSFEIIYDAHLTFDSNINIIENKINNIILNYYRKKV